MKTFIKVTEIWIPDKSRTQLEFGSGHYGNLTDFKTDSAHQKFAYNEGLPGKAWAEGHPIVLSQFEDSYFKRTLAAKNAGLTCGIALPIFSGEFLMAVVVFLCGDDKDHAGAIEVWHQSLNTDNTLSVMDGYYGTLQNFETISKKLSVSKGQGIAGMTWQSGMPVLIEDIGSGDNFVRAKEAQAEGITAGISIPVYNNPDKPYVMTFLSAKATPIAKRIQIWIPNFQGTQLICQQGFSKDTNDLAAIFETLPVTKAIGALGRVWLTGIPIITGDNESDYSPELDNLSTMLAIPVIENGHLKAIISFLF